MTTLARILLAVTLITAAAPTVSAQSSKVDGKTAILRLFNDAIANARKSTVNVRYNGKIIGLGTIVDTGGNILAKGSDLFVAMKKPADDDGLQVKLWDGTRHTATVVGYHEGTDLVLLKIDAKDLVPVKFAESKAAEAGNLIAAAGSDSEPIAAGIISVGVRKLFDAEAAVENANRGYLGLVPDERKEGVFIGELSENSPARKAKLKVGDQIVRIEDRTVEKYEDLRKVLGNSKPGDKVRVFVRRKSGDDTEELEFEVKLGDRGRIDRGTLQNTLGGELSSRRTGFEKVITHDMVLEPKDCGGPLVDLEGRVLGINIARAGRVETWTLPPEVIKPALAELKAGKHPVKK